MAPKKSSVISLALGRFARTIDLDRAVLWGLSGKTLAGLSGPVTAVLIAYNFSPELQGYHYTFLSLLTLQLFVELGLPGVITTFASHEWSQLAWNNRGRIEGDPDALSRLSSLVSFGFRWFLAAAAILILLLAAGGYAFLSASPSPEPQVAWQGPWIGLCFATGISVMLVPAWAILQGCGQIEHVYFFRLLETALRALVMWIAILMGVGLWAVVIASCAALLWALGFLWSRYRQFFLPLRHVRALKPFDWRHDILPLQWRFALSWLIGSLMFLLFTPALFYFQGPVIAGQMGMTWVLVGGVSALAGTWLQVKAPEFGALIAQRRFQELDRLARKAGVTSFAAACVAGTLLLAVIAGLDRYAPELRGRLLPMLPIVVLIAAEVLHQISIAQSTYLRAFKREPFMMISIVSGLTVAVSTIIFAKYLGATGIAIAYLATIVMTLIWGTRVFVRCRKKWTLTS